MGFDHLLNPQLRTRTDPELGEYVPVKTQVFYALKVAVSGLSNEIGKGVFANEEIRKGSVIVVGGGQLTSDLSKAPKDKDFAGVFNEKYFMTPLDYDDPSPNWYINHSCDPNVKLTGGVVLLARRDIKKGDELTIDYAVVGAGNGEWQMECRCNYSSCRKLITNNDWKNKQMFTDYFEEWAPFIQKKGARLFFK